MIPAPRLCVPLLALCAGALAVALPGGCNRKAPRAPTTVRGAVTFQGKPLPGALVVFSPDPERGGSGKSARARVGPDGRYELRQADLPVVAPGWYRVAIAAEPTSPPPGGIFPAKLSRPDLSGLLREVKPDRENVFEFAVEVPQVDVAAR
ncbi:carboxypeptidase-like regulatory domain-containing protein [Gemmata sp.]|uniref:carboxypeptidase-like regulatory domain-containing protein n=1 Tax=Gemmata sp. TaxID=1914242 RepID=UPI003F6F76D9